MDRKQHAWLARSLIDACGGPSAAAEVVRVRKSALGLYQDPNADTFMPADVIWSLEAYCGRPIYSEALTRSLPGRGAREALLAAACETTEAAGALQRLVRTDLAADWPITQAQRLELMRDVDVVDEHLAQIRVRLGSDEP